MLNHLFGFILFAELKDNFEYAFTYVEITKDTNQVLELLLMQYVHPKRVVEDTEHFKLLYKATKLLCFHLKLMEGCHSLLEELQLILL